MTSSVLLTMHLCSLQCHSVIQRHNFFPLQFFFKACSMEVVKILVAQDGPAKKSPLATL